MGLTPGDELDIILDCYRLAEIYHQAPDVFLTMPLNDVHKHLMRTAQLRDKQREQE